MKRLFQTELGGIQADGHSDEIRFEAYRGYASDPTAAAYDV